MLVLALALMGLDFGGRVSSRLRSVGQHVLAPSQSWLKGATLSLLGRDASDERGALESASRERLKGMVREAEGANAALAARIAALEEELRQVSACRSALGNKAVRFVPASVLSTDYLLAEGGLNIRTGTRDGVSRGQWVTTRAISQGETAGVRGGQGVITVRGLVGLVEKAGAYVSQVRLLTSPECRLAARIMHWEAGERRWVAGADTGLTQGTGDGRTLRLTQIPATARVAEGDYVVTATTETGLPEYLIIGRVVEAARRPTGLTYTILVAPQVRLERLDRVFVLAPDGPGAK